MKLFRGVKKHCISYALVLALMFTVISPSTVWAETNIRRVTGGELDIQGSHSSSETPSEGLVSRGTARNGKYNGEDGSAITWSLTSAGVLTVSGTGCLPRLWFDKNNNFFGTDIKTVTIKSGITSITDGAFFQCTNITKVTLPSSVTTIDFAAFGECSKLTTISIPANVSYIGEYAFYSCTSLKSITLPDAVTSIDTEAFANCSGLTSASIYGDIGTNAFNNCVSLSSLSINGSPLFIADGAFAYCSSLSTVNVPSSVAEIGVGAFAYCESLTDVIAYGDLSESAFDCCYALTNITLNSPCQNIGKRAFAECKAITTLTLPNTLKTVGEAAFQGCENLRSISLPSSITSLGSHAFYDCSSLTSVNIPSAVTKIDDCLFSNCSALTTVNLHSGITSIGDGAFGNCTALSTVNIPSACTSIGEQAFYGCTSLNNVTIPAGTISIKSASFYQCSTLKSITIPNSVQIISDHAFTGCKNLESADLGSGIESIGDYSFASCEKLLSISMPNSLTSIGEGAFACCSSLSVFAIPNGVTSIPTALFYGCDSLQTVTLNQGIESINDWAFMNCESLTSISIPDGTENIGKAVFSGCKSLETVFLPASITVLPDGLFLECESLQSVTAKGHIIEIGKFAFSNCINLTNLVGFSTVTKVGEYAFANAANLKNISFSDFESIGEGAFAFCDGILNVSIGPNVSSIGDMTFIGCSGLQSISVSENNPYYTTDGHLLYSKDMTKLIACISNGSSLEIIIPDSVKNISKYAFYECVGVQSVSLPSTLTKIEDSMFFGCTGLTGINIPQSVTSVGQYAFANCTNLHEIVLPTALSQIGEGAFMGCSLLSEIDFNNSVLSNIPSYLFAGCTSLRNIDIPNTVTFIGEYAFSGCLLTENFIIPDSVTEIADFAFKESKGIKSIVFPESIISLGRCAFDESKNLECVKFKGDIYAIGAGAFKNTPLKNVYFSGDALGVIGDEAFTATSEELLFHYNDAGEGWDTPVWEGPDQKKYKTSTVITGTCGEKLKWELVTHNGVLTISGTGEMYDSNTADSTPWHDYNNLIKSVIICDGVSSIGANMFSGIETLVEVSIPASVTKIGYAAFSNSQNISAVHTNGGLKAASKCMFYNCDQITSIELSEGLKLIEEYAFYGCANLEEIIIPSTVQTIGEGAFATCLSLETLRLKGTITNIGKGAFFNCVALNSIYVMMNAPKASESYAFSACNSELKIFGTTSTSWLKGFNGDADTESSCTISGTCESLTWSVNPLTRTLTFNGTGKIPDYSSGDTPWYQYNALIYSIEIGSGISSIGDYSLAELTNVNQVSLPSTVKSIGKYAFASCSSLNEIQMPSDLISIGEGAFSACVSLCEVTLPEGITSISKHTFSECLLLQSINAQSVISSIGYGAFYCCRSLKHISFLSNVQSIGDFAFTLCVELQDINLSACTSIGVDAFFCCSKLKNVNFSNNLVSMGKRAFSQTNITQLIVPRNLKEIPECAFELCNRLQSVSFNGNDHSIGIDAFYGCINLKNLDLNGVIEIGKHAFMACGMTEIHISQSVMDIGNGAFADCSFLSMFTSDSSAYAVANGVLYRGTQLVQFPAGKNVGGFNVPNHVTSIAPYSFYGCERLVEIGIGENVSSIGEAAFATCSGLRFASLGAKVNTIPIAAFGECTSLELVCFSGNAPTSIGDDAFYHCADSLVLEFISEKSGWTNETWVGPDGNTYATRTNIICIEVVNSFFDSNGFIKADLKLINNSDSALSITSLQIEDDRFSVETNCPLIIDSKGFDQSIKVSSKESIIGGACTCTVLVEVDGRYIILPLRFTPQDNYYMWAKSADNGAQVQIFNDTENEKQVCVVASIQSDKKTIVAKNHFCILPSAGYHNVNISFDGFPNSTDNKLVVHVLDADNYGPICQQCEISEIQSTIGDSGFVSITDEVTLRPRGTMGNQDGSSYYSANENIAPAEAKDHDISQSTDFGEFLISRSAESTGSGTYEYTATTYDVHISDINELMQLYMRGEKPSVEETSHIDEMRRFDINVNVGVSKPFANYKWRLGDQEESSSIKFFTATGSGTAFANIGSFSARDGYTKPNINISGSIKGTVAQAQLADRDFKVWLTRDWKVNVNSSLDVTSVELGGTVNLNGSGAELSGSFGADALKMNNKFSLSKGEHDLFSISADPGAGLSGSAKASISAKKIQFKVGTKVGLGGDVSIEINPLEILSAVVDSDMAKSLKEKIQIIRVYNDKNNGEQDLIASGEFIFDSDENIVSFCSLPIHYTSIYPGDSLYNVALPKSTGGTVMPLESLSSTAAGKKDTTTPKNKLTNKDKMKLASLLIGLPISRLSVAEMIISAYSASHSDVTNLITSVSKDVSAKIKQEVELNVSAKFAIKMKQQ